MTPERQQFRGRQIEIREGTRGLELRIDDVPVRYGRLPDGRYFLDDYAYDWADDLGDLARRYVEYRERVAAAQARAAKTPRREA